MQQMKQKQQQQQQQQPTRREYLADADDVVSDMLCIILEIWPELSDADLTRAERSIRDRWGGDEVYIARAGGADRNEAARRRSARDAAIWRDYCAGEHYELLSRRYGVGVQRIYQILTRLKAERSFLVVP